MSLEDAVSTSRSWQERYEASIEAERERLAGIEDPTPGGCLGEAVFEIAGGALVCAVLAGSAALIRWAVEHHPVIAVLGLIPVVVLMVTAGVLALRTRRRDGVAPPRGAARAVVFIAAGLVFLVVYWFLACGCW